MSDQCRQIKKHFHIWLSLALQCSDKTVEQVREFKFLGSWIENTGDVTLEIKRMIGQLSGIFNRLIAIWRSNKYSLRLKLRLFNSNVLSILMYASGCWKLNQQLEKRIVGFEIICLQSKSVKDPQNQLTSENYQ